jgi:hypothetical protein
VCVRAWRDDPISFWRGWAFAGKRLQNQWTTEALCIYVYMPKKKTSQNCLKSVLVLGGLRLGIADTLARAVALAGRRRQKPGHLVPCVVAALSD